MSMSVGAIAGGGSIGGFVAYLIVFVLPRLEETLQSGQFSLSVQRLVALFLVGAIYIFLGGIAPLVVGEVVHTKEAVAYGLSSVALLRGVMGGAHLAASRLTKAEG